MDAIGALRNSQSLGHFTSLTLDVRDRILVKLFASKITVYGGDRGLCLCSWHPSPPCPANEIFFFSSYACTAPGGPLSRSLRHRLSFSSVTCYRKDILLHSQTWRWCLFVCKPARPRVTDSWHTKQFLIQKPLCFFSSFSAKSSRNFIGTPCVIYIQAMSWPDKFCLLSSNDEQCNEKREIHGRRTYECRCDDRLRRTVLREYVPLHTPYPLHLTTVRG